MMYIIYKSENGDDGDGGTGMPVPQPKPSIN